MVEDRLDDALLIPPKVGAGRYVEIDSTSVGMAGIWANVHAPEAAALDQRLDALAATVCPGAIVLHHSTTPVPVVIN